MDGTAELAFFGMFQEIAGDVGEVRWINGTLGDQSTGEKQGDEQRSPHSLL